MDTYTHARGKTNLVLFILTLATTVIIAAGLILVTTFDGAADWAKGLVSADISWSENIMEDGYSLPHGHIEDHIRQSHELLEEHIQKSGERLDNYLKKN